jgi:hypothetical protein
VQIHRTNGWPNWTRNVGGTNWFSIMAGSNLMVSIPAPTNERATWRVPLTYQEDLSIQEEVSDKGKATIGYALAKIFGAPFSGIRRHPWPQIYSPELVNEKTAAKL